MPKKIKLCTFILFKYFINTTITTAIYFFIVIISTNRLISYTL